ncbi:AI-2E family transporter [Cupriavidus pampae]|uniref:Transport protein YhhT n=1 Tax=Cupriavidus pampae TaxID=659251 RepID=A0ABM8XJN9_9BURK|nr:AI-2E family transporter [Cupriavidus pampae]CAG9180396.1 Putative transport protein YhhT [Cupriavidus pampae]
MSAVVPPAPSSPSPAAPSPQVPPIEPVTVTASGDDAQLPIAQPFIASEDSPSARALRRSSIALVILATLASLYALHVSRTFLVPVVMSVVIAYLLDPAVEALQRYRVPRSIGATLVLLAAVTLLGGIAYLLQGQVESIVDRLPAIASKLSRSLGELMTGNESMVQKVRRAATVLSGAGQPVPARAPQVVVERSSDGLSNVLWLGSAGVFSIVAQATAILFLTWFLLLAGDMFKRKFIKMAGKTISQKKISVHMLAEINRSIQRYMVMLVVTNAALGACTWLLLKWLGVNNAGTWAVAAAALHLVPYFGAVLISACLGVAAFMQFGTIGMVAAAAGGSLAIATLIGSVVTTWMTGRMARMNAVAVFVALLLFTFLWGTWGMLLAIPLAVIAKVIADHVEGLEVLAEFLGE